MTFDKNSVSSDSTTGSSTPQNVHSELRGIEANPKKIKAILDIPSPRNMREVQVLVGKIISLNRFISRSADRSLPFFKILRNACNFEGTSECEEALQSMKQYLSCVPLLTKPVDGEHLFIYLSVSSEATSAVLVVIRERKHLSVYYLSKTLQGAEKRYTEIEKFSFALINASGSLRPYFVAHSITVLIDQSLKHILAKPDVFGRLIKWSIELS